ncbi:MAG TPA: hypothetical protein VK956_03625, partial [Verrucomicrobium sp.]|nr:hypothetical protein [Verrucomicrobium sp.]
PEALEVLPCWELQADDGDILTVQGAALASGYAVGREDGQWIWQPIDGEVGLTTRDRVQLWHHGRRQFLRFLGREAAFVKVLGELVSLPELQSKLEELCLEAGLPPTSCLVWPVPDERQDTRLVLVGEIPEADLEALCGKFNAGVPGYQKLGDVHRVESIPRTALGKVDRVGMATLFKTGLTRFSKD